MCTRFRKLCLGALLAAALFIANTGQAFAQNPAAPGGGPQEGIKVHGDWVIEVHNPDGSLADRREFKNALTSGGSVLALLIGRQKSAGFWGVGLQSPDGNRPCGAGSVFGGITQACGIYEEFANGYNSNFPPMSKDLHVNTAVSGRLQLSGNVTATYVSTISEVYTFLGTCAANYTGTVPCESVGTEFSRTGAFAPVPVVAGQIIQVTVTFTFS